MKNLLSDILEKETLELDKPSLNDWEKIERKFDCQFPIEFKYFLELMCSFSFPGDILNVSLGKTNGNDTIEFTYDYEMKEGGWQKELIPFYNIGNGDYFCLLSSECPKTGVYYYSHEDGSIEKEADTFEQWIRQLPDFLS